MRYSWDGVSVGFRTPEKSGYSDMSVVPTISDYPDFSGVPNFRGGGGMWSFLNSGLLCLSTSPTSFSRVSVAVTFSVVLADFRHTTDAPHTPDSQGGGEFFG